MPHDALEMNIINSFNYKIFQTFSCIDSTQCVVLCDNRSYFNACHSHLCFIITSLKSENRPYIFCVWILHRFFIRILETGNEVNLKDTFLSFLLSRALVFSPVFLLRSSFFRQKYRRYK